MLVLTSIPADGVARPCRRTAGASSARPAPGAGAPPGSGNWSSSRVKTSKSMKAERPVRRAVLAELDRAHLAAQVALADRLDLEEPRQGHRSTASAMVSQRRSSTPQTNEDAKPQAPYSRQKTDSDGISAEVTTISATCAGRATSPRSRRAEPRRERRPRGREPGDARRPARRRARSRPAPARAPIA